MIKLLLSPVAMVISFWTKYAASQIHKKGRLLTSIEKKIAHKINIKNPKQVRILEVDKITHPLSWTFTIASRFTKSVISNPIGLTLGHSIYIAKDYKQDLLLITHELIHVKQYEEKGGQIPFLKEYIFQCLKYGYANCPLEVEADTQSRLLLSNNMA